MAGTTFKNWDRGRVQRSGSTLQKMMDQDPSIPRIQLQPMQFRSKTITRIIRGEKIWVPIILKISLNRCEADVLNFANVPSFLFPSSGLAGPSIKFSLKN